MIEQSLVSADEAEGQQDTLRGGMQVQGRSWGVGRGVCRVVVWSSGGGVKWCGDVSRVLLG